MTYFFLSYGWLLHQVVEGLAKKANERFAWDSYREFLEFTTAFIKYECW